MRKLLLFLRPILNNDQNDQKIITPLFTQHKIDTIFQNVRIYNILLKFN